MIRSIIGGFIGCLLANYFIEELAKEKSKVEPMEEIKEQPKEKKTTKKHVSKKQDNVKQKSTN